jgi:hypothetical protein
MDIDLWTVIPFLWLKGYRNPGIPSERENAYAMQRTMPMRG